MKTSLLHIELTYICENGITREWNATRFRFVFMLWNSVTAVLIITADKFLYHELLYIKS